MDWIILLTLFLLLFKWLMQIGLECLNLKFAKSKSQYADTAQHFSPEEKSKSLRYLQAQTQLILIDLTVGTLILAVVLFSGVLPFSYQWLTSYLSVSGWTNALYLFGVILVLSTFDMPLDWYRQFVLEEKFGFNNSTQALWWWDKFLGLILAAVLVYPLLVLILWIVTLTGSTWWFWVWVALTVYQLLIVMIAPNWIMPLFNKFTPLEEGSLKQRIAETAQQSGVEFESISVMDGSKRSAHSNAFLTGLGRFKKIALYDTLIEQLSEMEIAAVTAHELGHYVRKHIAKRLIWMSVLLLAELYVVSVLIELPWLIEPFGFEPGNFTTGLLLISLLSGLFTFWLNPIENYYSRKHEYEADAYAKEIMQESQPMISALQKMEKENLSNPTPHPLYSTFYYSHPTVQERVKALS